MKLNWCSVQGLLKVLPWFSVLIALVFVLFLGAPTTALAQGPLAIYNSIPSPLPVDSTSAGAEAVSFAELGDGLNLTASAGTIGQVTVVLNSWACQSGGVYAGNCVSGPGASFEQPITINIYSVTYNGDVPGPLKKLGSITKTFAIPYRPTSNPTLCPASAATFGLVRWYDSADKSCYYAINQAVTVDFTPDKIAIPVGSYAAPALGYPVTTTVAGARIIVTVAYNTSDAGPEPLGDNTACHSTTEGCPYDSLNIAVAGVGPTGLANGVGAFLDWNGIFVNYTNPANSCSGEIATGELLLDTSATTPCWSGLHPLIEVQATPGTVPPWSWWVGPIRRKH
jgi:hypothetical protein